LRAYIDAAGIVEDRKGWLFRTARGHNGKVLSKNPQTCEKRGRDLPGAMGFRALTIGSYRRQDAPFTIAALNREVGWRAVVRHPQLKLEGAAEFLPDRHPIPQTTRQRIAMGVVRKS
jgi:hypothetical protein